jgi:hypothetical protein
MRHRAVVSDAAVFKFNQVRETATGITHEQGVNDTRINREKSLKIEYKVQT